MEGMTQSAYPPSLPSHIKQDITETLRKIPTLRLTTLTALNETRSCVLYALEGTLPGVYQRRQIAVPIRLVLGEHFPSQAPICLLVPTESLSIVSSRMVDSRLRIQHPALSNWTDSSSLSGFLIVLIRAFGQQCPVEPRLGVYFNPYGVTVSQANEKIRGFVHTLAGEGEREVAGLEHTLIVLERRAAALNLAKVHFQETTRQLKTRNQLLQAQLEKVEAEVAHQLRLTSPATPIYEALPPVKPEECHIFNTVTRAQALGDTLALLELQLEGKRLLKYQDLSLFREVAHSYFLACRQLWK